MTSDTFSQTDGEHAMSVESLNQCAKNSCAKVEQCVQQYPRSSMLVSLGAGLGVGLLIGAALSNTRAGSGRWIERQTAERLGQRLISHMGNLLPDAISDRLSKS